MLKHEKEFETKFVDVLRAVPGGHLIPIPDDAKSMLKFCPELKGMVEQKIYDLGYLHKGSYFAFELKVVDRSFTFNTSIVEDHQVQFLKEAVAAGGRGYVLVRFLRGVTKTQASAIPPHMLRSPYLLDIIYAVPIHELRTFSLFSNPEFKTVDLNHIEEFLSTHE